MGPPRTRAQQLAAAQARSRFHEGSMNDRASAAPPVAFLGQLAPAEQAALERPVMVDDRARGGNNDGEEPPVQKTQQGRRMALLGQMWEGVRGRLRLRRDAGSAAPAAPPPAAAASAGADEGGRKEQAEAGKAPEEAGGDRPSREQVLANYHQLVASGFFSSHATYSTRPPGTRPLTAHGARPQSRHGAHHDAGSNPQWPLAPPTPPASRASPVCSPVCSPASCASSRGTKRTAAEHDEDEAEAEAEAGMNIDGGSTRHDDADEDASTLAHRFLPKRLRRSASRDISLPKLRGITSRRTLAASGRRSISMADAAPSKLTKRVPGGSFPDGGPPCHQETYSLRGRHAGDTAARPVTPLCTASLSSRTIRPRTSAEPLSVVPDVNRGIPSVPAIPAKFTYGRDRENAGPWRGLRRAG